MKNRELKENINADLFRYYGVITTKIFLSSLLFNPGFRYMYLFRKCVYYQQNKSYIPHFFYKMLLSLQAHGYGCEIPETVVIGKGFYIGHMWGITINPQACIGNNVNIAKGVTIGQTNRGEKKGIPTIGNRVWLGINSIVVGGIKIEDNVLIGPGAYVNFDVPANSMVLGNPGKIISSSSSIEGYIENTVDEN